MAWVLAAALVGAGCVRPGGGGAQMARPGVGEPAPAADPLAGCAVADLPKARLWRLTQVQLRNTLRDLFGFAGVAVDSLPAESRLEGFANGSDGLGVPPLLMDKYHTVAEEIASEAVRRSSSLLPCRLEELGGGPCLRDFLAGFGLRVWRRPLSGAEVTRLAGVYSAAAAATDAGNGLRSLLKALLLSPNFLFRSELGGAPGPDGMVRLTEFEMAAALSYLFWDTTPDETLLHLASVGRLSEPLVLRAQARRLLRSTPRAAPVFTAFVRQWLKIEDLVRSRKDRKVFPMYGSAVAADLLEENRRFVESVAFDPGGDRRLRTLLTAPYGFVNARTAAIYGLAAPEPPSRNRRRAAVAAEAAPAPGGPPAPAAGEPPAPVDEDPEQPDPDPAADEDAPPAPPAPPAPAGSNATPAAAPATAPAIATATSALPTAPAKGTGTAAIFIEGTALRAQGLDPGERRGLLTQGAFLAAHSGPDTPKLVARGSLVREQLLCGEVPEPPDDFKFDEAKITEDMTAREKFSVHATNPFCSRCHALFDSIGFALESYDAIGRFRRTDKNKPIDPSGKLTSPGGREIQFASFVELVERLADLPETQDCFARQYLTFATGRTAAEVSACEARVVARAFADSGHRLDALMLGVVESPGFFLRRK